MEFSNERFRRVWPVAAVLAASIVPLALIDEPITSRILSITTVCLLLWLFELVPPFVPTLLLWTLIAIALPAHEPAFSLGNTLKWAADPVLALFFGGFALGVAAERHQLDRKVANLAFGRERSFPATLAIAIALTAFLSMWISNIAAAALMFTCIRPLAARWPIDSLMRRTLLVAVALGANLGGMGTPIGTGPNAIAIANISAVHQVTFVDWMIFAVPLSAGLLLAGFLLLLVRIKGVPRQGDSQPTPITDSTTGSGGQRGFLIVFFSAVLLWLTEPLHGIPAAVIALGAAVVLFLSGLLRKTDLTRIDWSTLLLIAGGITIGRLIEASGLIGTAVESAALAGLPPMLTLFILCLASAVLSALMSNTATAVLLIPIGMALVPAPSTAILIAISASFGMPFIISTPPNAMAYGEGGLHTSDLLYPGVVIMILGCAIVSLTGPAVLSLVGIQ